MIREKSLHPGSIFKENLMRSLLLNWTELRTVFKRFLRSVIECTLGSRAIDGNGIIKLWTTVETYGLYSLKLLA